MSSESPLEPRSVDEQVALLLDRVESFTRAVRDLPDDLYLGGPGRWTPRDVVAHLVGWNRYVIEGSRQIQAGELPFYDLDPGEDFANVNAVHIRDHPSRDRGELLGELRASADELVAFLRELEPDRWARDFGVRHGAEELTVRSTVQDLIDDYAAHERQLDDWGAAS